jgi:spermidine synthase
MTITTPSMAQRTGQSGGRDRAFDRLLLLIVFVGGTSSIAIELSASRLLGPYFGTSTFIWANLIGLTLLYLSVGYFVGGKVADRWPRATLLFVITTIAGFTTGLIPLLARPILEQSLTAFAHLAVGAFYGSLVGVILLFAVPVTLLGIVSPFAIRLRLHRVDAAGNTAGSLYALSTVGSILGSFLPVLVLEPAIGTYRTFYTFALLLLLTSILGLGLLKARWLMLGAVLLALVIIGITVFGTRGMVRPPDFGELVYETESEYNYIQVIKDRGAYLLMLNDGHAIHSIYDPNDTITGGPWDYFTVGPFFNHDQKSSDVHSVALIGLAAGTMAKELTLAYGPIPIDGVEIDPKIVDVGRKYFDMTEPNLNVIVQDGRYFLSTTKKRYDIVGIDAYRQPYIPFHLTTQEFFDQVKSHLTPDGVVVVNAGRTETDYRLVDVMASTMKSVFPNVYLIDVDRYTNTIVVGTRQPTHIQSFRENILRQNPGLIRDVGEISLTSGNIREWTGTDPKLVFTDDHAPVERVVDEMIISGARGQ